MLDIAIKHSICDKKDYLEAFENGSCELSMRQSCVLYRLEVRIK